MTAPENSNLNYNSKKIFIENNSDEPLCFHGISQVMATGAFIWTKDKHMSVSHKKKPKTCKTSQKLDCIVEVVMIAALWRLEYVQ